MVKDALNGLMGKAMKESTLKIKSMVRGNLLGRMVKNILASGDMENSMELEYKLLKDQVKGLAFGKKGKGLDGLKEKSVRN